MPEGARCRGSLPAENATENLVAHRLSDSQALVPEKSRAMHFTVRLREEIADLMLDPKGRDCRWIDCRGNGQSMIGLKRSNSISRCWSEHAIDWSGVITVLLQLRLHI